MVTVAGLVNCGSPAQTGSSGRQLAERLAESASRAGGLGLAVSGLVVSEVIQPLGDPDDVAAMIQLWCDDGPDGPARALAELRAQMPDGLRLTAWSVREHVLKRPVEREEPDPHAGCVKLAGTAYRRDDFSLPAFFDYWRTVHAPVSASVPGVGGYVVSEVLDTVSGDWSPDALLEQWWPDQAAFERSGETPQAAAAWEDVANYAKTTGVFWLLREHVIVVPPATGPGLLESTGA